MINIYNKSYTWLFFALTLAFLLPNHYYPWLSFHADFLSACAFLPLLILLSNDRLKIPVTAIAAFALSLFFILQFIFNKVNYFGDSLIASLYVFGFGVCVIFGKNRLDFNGVNVESYIFSSFVFASIISTGISLHQWLDLGFFSVFIAEPIDLMRFSANLAQPNQLSTLTILGFVGGVYFLNKKMIGKSTFLLIVIISSISLILSKSRTPIIQLLFLLVLFFFYCKENKRFIISSTVAFLFLYVVGVGGWGGINDLLLMYSDGGGFRKTTSDRTQLWAMAWNAIELKPLLGYGVNQIISAHLGVAGNYPVTYTLYDSAHNIILDLFLWIGIPFSIIFLGVYFNQFLKVLRNKNLSVVALSVISVLLVHASLEFPLYYAYFLLPFGFFWGVIDFDKNYFCVGVSKKISLGIFVLLSFFMQYILFDYLRVEHFWRELRFEKSKFSSFSESGNLFSMYTNLMGFMDASKIEVKRDITKGEVDEIHKAAMRFGYSSILFKDAVVHALINEHEEAEFIFNNICKTSSKAFYKNAVIEWNNISVDKFPELKMVKIKAECN